MKRTIVLMVISVLLLLGVSVCSAGATPTKGSKGGAPLNDPSLTPAVVAELDRLTEEKEAALGIGAGGVSAMALNKYGLQTRPATNYRQETGYWCGPASARQSLSFHKTSSRSTVALPSQATLANRIGTTPSGSLTTAIANTMNSYRGTFGSNFNYIASNLVGTDNPYEHFVNRIGFQLRSITTNPTIPITLMQTSRIPRYWGHVSRHYMSISGINDNVSPMVMRSVDPNSNIAYYGIYWDAVGATNVNGLFRACLQADLDGTNMAMAW